MKAFTKLTLIFCFLVISPFLLAQKKPLFKSKLLKGGQAAQKVSVDVSKVKNLYLIATEGPDNYNHDQSIWADPVLIDKTGKRIDLTKIKPSSVKVGWGKLILNKDHKNNPLNICGDSYEKGFWAHAPSVLSFKLDGKYKKFEAMVGVGSAAGKNGSVIFEVSSKLPKTKAPKPKVVVNNQDSPFDPEAMTRAIKDMAKTWPELFKDSEVLLEKVQKFKSELKNADDAKIKEMQEFRKAVLLRNPLLEFDKLLLIRRKGNQGLPTNWTSNSSIPKNNYTNDLAMMSIKDKNGKLNTIFRPETRKYLSLNGKGCKNFGQELSTSLSATTGSTFLPNPGIL